jgi:hypothetical protein
MPSVTYAFIARVGSNHAEKNTSEPPPLVVLRDPESVKKRPRIQYQLEAFSSIVISACSSPGRFGPQPNHSYLLKTY